MQRQGSVFASIFLLVAALTAVAPWAQLPTGVQLTAAFGTQSLNRFTRPVGFMEIPGKPGHFLVTEVQTGSLWALVPEGTGYVKKLFWKVAVKTANSMGLFGLAFHPDFPRNHLYYVQYNPLAGSRTLLIEERSADASLLEDSKSAGRTLLSVPLPQEFDGHQGGNVGFGPDGFLYIGIGDGGWSCYTAECADIYNSGQNRKTLLAKMLRIDVDHPSGGLPYGIPADNPFVNDSDPAVRKEIWAYGLRNPWRWTFNPRNGDLLVGDVGANLAEEVDIVVKGGNYGWKLAEGAGCRIAGTCDPKTFIAPLAALTRQQAGCIIGGYVFEGRAGSKFDGAYLFADYLTRKIFALTYAGNSVKELKEVGATPAPITSLGRDAQGNLYMVGETGTIYKLVHAELQPQPTASLPAHGRQAGSRPRILPRAGGKGYRFDRQAWPDALVLVIKDFRGRRLRILSAAEIDNGALVVVPSGIHLVSESRARMRINHVVHLQ